MLTKRVIASLLAAGMLSAALFAAPAQGADDTFWRRDDKALTALNILPPGQGRYLNGAELLQAQTEGSQPAQNTNQAQMYADLITVAPNVKGSDLENLYKSAHFGYEVSDVADEYSPRDGVTVVRDESYNVPHIYGKSREDVMFGAGYVTAEDRLFMMDTLRWLGRGRLSEFLGASDANLQSDRAIYASSGYTEEELEGMIERLKHVDPVRGKQIIEDINAYAEGVNQFIAEATLDPELLPAEYEALQQIPLDWLPTDTAAVASLIG